MAISPVPRGQCFHYAAETMAHGQWADKALSAEAPSIDPALLLHSVADTLGAVGIDTSVAKIDYNAAESSSSYLYDVRAGDSLLFMRVQLSPTPAYAEYLPAEMLARRRAQKAGIATPQILATSEDAIQLAGGITFSVEQYGGPSAVTWLENHPKDADRFVTFLAGQLAMLHTEPIESGYSFFDPAAAREGQLRGIHDDYRPAFLGSLDFLLEIAVEAQELTPHQATQLRGFYHTSPLIDKLAAEPRVLLHGDTGAHNLLVGPAGTPSALVDFEEAQAGPTLRDLAAALCPMEALPQTSGKWPSLLEAYEAAGGYLPRGYEPLLAALTMRLEINWIAATLRILPAIDDAKTTESCIDLMKASKQRLLQNGQSLGLL